MTLYGIYGIRNMEKMSSEYFVYSDYSETPVLNPKTGFLTHFWSILLVSSYVLCFAKFNFDVIRKMQNMEYGINRVSFFAKIRNSENSTLLKGSDPETKKHYRKNHLRITFSLN